MRGLRGALLALLAAGLIALLVLPQRIDLLDRVLHPRPWLKRLIARIPGGLHPRPGAYGLVLRLGADGGYLSSLHDPGGKRFPYITSVEERDGSLYLGSVEADAVGLYRLRPQGERALARLAGGALAFRGRNRPPTATARR